MLTTAILVGDWIIQLGITLTSDIPCGKYPKPPPGGGGVLEGILDNNMRIWKKIMKKEQWFNNVLLPIPNLQPLWVIKLTTITLLWAILSVSDRNWMYNISIAGMTSSGLIPVPIRAGSRCSVNWKIYLKKIVVLFHTSVSGTESMYKKSRFHRIMMNFSCLWTMTARE